MALDQDLEGWRTSSGSNSCPLCDDGCNWRLFSSWTCLCLPFLVGRWLSSGRGKGSGRLTHAAGSQHPVDHFQKRP